MNLNYIGAFKAPSCLVEMRSVWYSLSSYVHAGIHIDICHPILSLLWALTPFKAFFTIQVVPVSYISVLESGHLPHCTLLDKEEKTLRLLQSLPASMKPLFFPNTSPCSMLGVLSSGFLLLFSELFGMARINHIFFQVFSHDHDLNFHFCLCYLANLCLP